MKVINIYEAKSQLSRLVEAALNGDEIVIARNGDPIIRLVPYKKKKKRKLGFLKGKVRMSKNFDDPLPEALLNLFDGSEK